MPVWIVTHGWHTGIAFRLADLPARAAPVRRYRKRTETGQFDLVPVPYLFKLDGGAVARVRVDDRSILSVRRDAPGGPFTLCRGDEGRCTTEFVRAHAWQGLRTTDGAKPFAAGVEHLDDMLVVNLAPGCEYFRVRDELGGSLRCSFCAYGRFDGRAVAMGQEPGRVDLPLLTLRRLGEILSLATELGEAGTSPSPGVRCSTPPTRRGATCRSSKRRDARSAIASG